MAFVKFKMGISGLWEKQPQFYMRAATIQTNLRARVSQKRMQVLITQTWEYLPCTVYFWPFNSPYMQNFLLKQLSEFDTKWHKRQRHSDFFNYVLIYIDLFIYLFFLSNLRVHKNWCLLNKLYEKNNSNNFKEKKKTRKKKTQKNKQTGEQYSKMSTFDIITKACLFKYTEKFYHQKMKISDKKLWYFSYFCSKHRLWVLVRTASRQF